ncbi:hypothetical protein HYX05_00955 [Candidatus Woesearchaeota archaeon]|nr:hypothetical protein [Candidatus Woesearchaeota archaeon]
MKSIELAKKLEGLNTLGMVRKNLGVKKSTAIKILSLLRKEGFVETSGGGKKPRLYKISPIRVAGKEHLGLYDIINKYSKVKLFEPFKHKVMDRKLTIEEAIPMAIKQREFRLTLASLGLFNFVKDWSKLHYFAKKYDVMKEVGALYDVARSYMKTRKMDERTRKSLLKTKTRKRFIIKHARSKDFTDIGKRWNVYVPFNKADLTRYKE